MTGIKSAYDHALGLEYMAIIKSEYDPDRVRM